jgi:hypothetical protein
LIALALTRLFNVGYWSEKVNIYDVLKHKWYKPILGFEVFLTYLKTYFSFFLGNLLLKCRMVNGENDFHSFIMMFLRTGQEYLEKEEGIRCW